MLTRAFPDHLTSNGYRLERTPDRLGELTPVLAHEREDRRALWSRLSRHGYLYLPGFLSRAVVERFREHYFEQLAGTGLLDSDSPARLGKDGRAVVDQALVRERLFNQLVPGRAYEDFCTQPAIWRWFTWLFDDECFLHRRKIIRHVRPGQSGIGSATQAHYDLVYLREGTDRLLSLWVPLGDTPLELGPLVYLEGSHRRYTQAERTGTPMPVASITADLPGLAEEQDTRWLVTDFEAGDVMVHSPYMVHAALDNRDVEQRLRLSTDIRYQRATDPIDWRWQSHWHEDDGL